MTGLIILSTFYIILPFSNLDLSVLWRFFLRSPVSSYYTAPSCLYWSCLTQLSYQPSSVPSFSPTVIPFVPQWLLLWYRVGLPLFLHSEILCAISSYSSMTICLIILLSSQLFCVPLRFTMVGLLTFRAAYQFEPRHFYSSLNLMITWHLLHLHISDRVFVGELMAWWRATGWRSPSSWVSHWLSPIGPSPRVWAVFYMTASSLPYTLSLSVPSLVATC